MGAGLVVAVIGSAVLGLVECGLATASVAGQLGGDEWPVGLIVAAVGKASVTHALLWFPVLVVWSVLHWLAGRWRGLRPPEPAAVGVFVVLAGWVVVPADLEIIRKATAILVVIACCGSLLAGLAAYAVMRRLFSFFGPARMRRGFSVVGLAALVLIVLTGICFSRSSLFDAQAYRLGLSQARQTPTARPNVLWIVLDTVRADRMSCHGFDQPTTPFLDQWADRSVVFDRAVSNGVWTVPSHASMFTGLSVRQHGTDYRNTWLDESIPTVAELLRSNGYATAMFSNNPWVCPDTNLAKGFDTCWVAYHLRHVTRFSLEFLCEKWGVTPLVPWLDSDFGAALTNHWVSRWLDRHAYGDKPFFVFVNYLDAHLPYRVPRRYRRMFLTEQEVHRSYDLRRMVYGDIVTNLDLKFNIDGPNRFAPADRQIMRGQYLAVIRYLDDRVRELIETFEQRGLLDNTLVVIVSDHGENLDNHGMWGHRFLTYDTLARVSLLIREPGRREGRRITTPVQLSDLHPTVLNAVIDDPTVPDTETACDLLELAARGGADRVAITEYATPEPPTVKAFLERGDTEAVHRTQPQIAAGDGRFRYIASSDGRRELYDLANDPGELHNLIDTRRDEAERLAAHIDAWLDRVPQYEPSRPGAAPPMPPEVVEALRSLGYIDGD